MGHGIYEVGFGWFMFIYHVKKRCVEDGQELV